MTIIGALTSEGRRPRPSYRCCPGMQIIADPPEKNMPLPATGHGSRESHASVLFVHNNANLCHGAMILCGRRMMLQALHPNHHPERNMDYPKGLILEEENSPQQTSKHPNIHQILIHHAEDARVVEKPPPLVVVLRPAASRPGSVGPSEADGGRHGTI